MTTDASKDAMKAWYVMRVEAINAKISVYDILRTNGVKFKSSGDREEQISCPFHGKDEKPSARVWPTTPQGPSHVWCYVCRERWDVPNLWRKYHGGTFHKVLTDLERYAGLETPKVPSGVSFRNPTVNEAQKDRYEATYRACENRLVRERGSYDMHSYLLVGSILDKVAYQVDSSKISFADALEVLSKVLAKIGERVRRSVPSNQGSDA